MVITPRELERIQQEYDEYEDDSYDDEYEDDGYDGEYGEEYEDDEYDDYAYKKSSKKRGRRDEEDDDVNPKMAKIMKILPL